MQIYGHQYRIASDSSDAAQVQEAAAVLDQRMRRVAEGSRRKVPLEIAIQAAMEIADEVLSTRSRRDRLLVDADERISRFTRKLESQSDGPSPKAGDGPDRPGGDSSEADADDPAPSPRF